MTILAFLSGLLVGALAIAIYMQSKCHKAETQAEVLAAQLEQEGKAHEVQLEQERKAHASQLEQERKAHAEVMSSQQEHFNELIAQHQRQYEEMAAKMTAQMQLATEEMLRQRQKEFADSSTASIGQIVNPLRDTIDRMKQVMAESTEKQTAMSSEMKVNIDNMLRQSAAAQKSAEELTRTFKIGNRVQGDWGETILNELLESQGLTCGVHYDVQAYMRDENGNILKNAQGVTMRPDVILHLDSKRDVIIDSKVSLSAFIDYANADNEASRQHFLKLHIDSLRSHVRSLASKDYSSYVRPPKQRMDYVIMFVPHSAALWTAINAQPDLWRSAMTQNVFIADEQTLFAALRIVSLTWKQIQQAQNHEKVFALANEMIDRVGQFVKKYQDLKVALDKACQAYEDGARKLQPSGQSILVTCAKLQKLGATSKKLDIKMDEAALEDLS